MSMSPSHVTTVPSDATQPTQDDVIIQHAIALLEDRLFRRDVCLQSPNEVRQFLKLKLAPFPHEVFAMVFLDARHRVIAFEPMFHGTIDAADVHPRVILERVIDRNAAAVVMAHNHPSGMSAPSDADQALTEKLKLILGYVDVRVLDHFIIGEGEPYSFAEAGLL